MTITNPVAKQPASKSTAQPAAKKPVAKKQVAKKPVAAKAAKPAAKVKAQKPAPLKQYKLLTGIDDSAFCERVCDHLKLGYELYGSPAITFNGKNNIVAQAIVLKKKHNKKKK
jgi:hypothetical protein